MWQRTITITLCAPHISMRRAYNVITVSMIVMSVMFLLAISVLGMVMHVTSSPGEMTLIPLSLCVSLHIWPPRPS